MYQKVENAEGLVRDTNSNAILASDPVALRRHRAHRMAVENDKEKIKTLEERVEALESLIKEHLNIADKTGK